jgi:hypothetical protein
VRSYYRWRKNFWDALWRAPTKVLEDVDLLLVTLERITFLQTTSAYEKGRHNISWTPFSPVFWALVSRQPGGESCSPSRGWSKEHRSLETGGVGAWPGVGQKVAPVGSMRVYTDNTIVLSWWSRGVSATWVQFLARSRALPEFYVDASLYLSLSFSPVWVLVSRQPGGGSCAPSR